MKPDEDWRILPNSIEDGGSGIVWPRELTVCDASRSKACLAVIHHFCPCVYTRDRQDQVKQVQRYIGKVQLRYLREPTRSGPIPRFETNC